MGAPIGTLACGCVVNCDGTRTWCTGCRTANSHADDSISLSCGCGIDGVGMRSWCAECKVGHDILDGVHVQTQMKCTAPDCCGVRSSLCDDHVLTHQWTRRKPGDVNPLAAWMCRVLVRDLQAGVLTAAEDDAYANQVNAVTVHGVRLRITIERVK